MASEPTPEEAAEALREVTDRRHQAVDDLDAYPKWALWAMAGLAILAGVSMDLNPEMSTPLLYLLGAIGLVLAYLPRWKRLGSAMGYRRSPTTSLDGIPARTRMLHLGMMLTMMVLVVVGSRVMQTWDVPYPGTIVSVVILVVVLLWSRLLNRRTRQPKAADVG